jgi:hypothetical protein
LQKSLKTSQKRDEVISEMIDANEEVKMGPYQKFEVFGGEVPGK